jgi:hypothetical protein
MRKTLPPGFCAAGRYCRNSYPARTASARRLTLLIGVRWFGMSKSGFIQGLPDSERMNISDSAADCNVKNGPVGGFVKKAPRKLGTRRITCITPSA